MDTEKEIVGPRSTDGFYVVNYNGLQMGVFATEEQARVALAKLKNRQFPHVPDQEKGEMT